MIATDQPVCFPDDVLVKISSVDDGTMLDRSSGLHTNSVMDRRRTFCQAAGHPYSDSVYQRVEYEQNASYEVIQEVNRRSTVGFTPDVAADALFTKTPEVGLFLPVADCVATVIYDAKNRYLSMLHLGRHSTLSNLVQLVINKFTDEGSNPADLIAWMSPSAKRQTYRLEYFDRKDDPNWKPFYEVKPEGVYIDMQGYNRQQLLNAGLQTENIHISSINTMTSDDYFSHAAGDTHGRMVVLAMMHQA